MRTGRVYVLADGVNMLNSFLDKMPKDLTIFFGIVLVFLPILPEPHIYEKAMMLYHGLDLEPKDWLDFLIFHPIGGVVAFLKWRRVLQCRAQGLADDGTALSAQDSEADQGEN